jgi:hypothetical protein
MKLKYLYLDQERKFLLVSRQSATRCVIILIVLSPLSITVISPLLFYAAWELHGALRHDAFWCGGQVQLRCVQTCTDHQLNAQFHLFYNNIYYIMILNMFRASLCSSSGGQIVYLQFLVSSQLVHCMASYRVWRYQKLQIYNLSCSNCIFAVSVIVSIGALYGILQSVMIPETANIQFFMLETCWGSWCNIITE